jgi:hypothetical protein
MRVLRWLWVSLALGAGACALAGSFAITLWSVRPEHLRLPAPRGMVLRIELAEAEVPWGNASIRRSSASPTRLVVTERVEYEIDYPSGARATKPVAVAELDDPSVDAAFDFDGDGTQDALHCELSSDGHRVLVTSGATGKGLFVHDDPREYEYETGAFPLGDLDGDGCAELALAHPRMDRSDYDPEPYDAVLGARSWITIVSGRLASAR